MKSGKNPSKKKAPRTGRSSPPRQRKAIAEIEPPTVEVQGNGGRPSKYTDAIIADICERIAGGEPMATICREDGMPGVQTVYDWMGSKPGVSVAIARAREVGEDVIAADCLNIADDNGNDIRYTEQGVEITDNDVIQRAKLRIDTRLKLLAKWNPKKWGEKVDVTSGGEKMAATVIERVVIGA